MRVKFYPLINIDNEKRSKILLESYQKAYPDVLKQNLFKATQREWNRVKNSLKFLLTLQRRLPNIRQL